MEKAIKTSFLTWKDAFKQESENRLDIDIDKLCRYGVSFLDDSVKCILPNELVIIGAKSGQGKSDLGLQIAAHNAKRGKRVAVYYLEGGHKEAIARIKWRDICSIYYETYKDLGIEMDYHAWLVNEHIHPIMNKIEAQVYADYMDTYKDNLFFYNATVGLTIDDFLGSLLDFHDLETCFGEHLRAKHGFDLDLIIIDHLQYFSLTQGENEYAEITRIIREVKNITDKYNIPVILISHLRKIGKDAGLPDMEDFHGSSNIPKISTTSIMISPATDKQQLSLNIFPTYMRVVKSRVGIKSTYAALIDFDLARRSYLNKYDLCKVNYFGEVSTEPMEDGEKPRWARRKDVLC